MEVLGEATLVGIGTVTANGVVEHAGNTTLVGIGTVSAVAIVNEVLGEANIVQGVQVEETEAHKTSKKNTTTPHNRKKLDLPRNHPKTSTMGPAKPRNPSRSQVHRK